MMDLFISSIEHKKHHFHVGDDENKLHYSPLVDASGTDEEWQVEVQM